MLKIEDFTPAHVEEARAIARENYMEARGFAPALPDIDTPSPAAFAGNGLGVAARDGDTLVGYLLGCNPWEGAFGSTARGTFSPLHANGAHGDHRGRIYARMYQAAAETWVARGIGYHAICLYAHERAVMEALFAYGFGQRCADAIRAAMPIACKAQGDVTFAALQDDRRDTVLPLRLMLSAHMGNSPTFMRDSPEGALSHAKRAAERAERVFAAFADGQPVAFLDISKDGESFASEAPDVRNITGAYCLPEFRGGEIFVNLLNTAIADCKARGASALGVDYESINPAANAFWRKHFTPYTASVTRRIDEEGFAYR